MIIVHIRPAMKRKGWKPEDLAEHADVAINTARAWYFGVATRIDLPILDRVCKVLNIEPGEALKQTEDASAIMEELKTLDFVEA